MCLDCLLDYIAKHFTALVITFFLISTIKHFTALVITFFLISIIVAEYFGINAGYVTFFIGLPLSLVLAYILAYLEEVKEKVREWWKKRSGGI